MSTSTIGVQRILPRSGTAWKGQKPSLAQSDDENGDSTDAPKTDSAPSEPAVGRYVDRNA
jgi:hypothetical protein